MIEDRSSPAEKVSIETLVNILQHLTTSDRKHARLVNSKWNQSCKNLVFQQRQKFLLDGLTHKLQLGSVLEVLQNGNYQYYNLEFHNEDFHLSLTEFIFFIKSNSLHIHSLSLVNCKFPFLLVEEITMNCLNLEELIFKDCWCDDFEETKLISNSKYTIIRKNPISIEIDNFRWMTYRVLEIFINIYQNVKRIRISIDFYVKFTINIHFNLEPWKLYFLAHPIRECFDDVFFQELKSSCPRITLEELGVPDAYDSFSLYGEFGYEDFIKTHKHLKSFDTSSCYFFDIESLEKLFLHCPNVEFLYLRPSMFDYCRNSEEDVKKVLALVAKSKLKALTIPNFSMPLKETSSFPKFDQNPNLLYLDISYLFTNRSKAICDTFIVTVLKTFSNLTYLNLSSINVQGLRKEVTKKIFQDQVQLKYLILNRCSWVSDRVFKRCSLIRLEHLELTDTRITHLAFRHFNFPKLKFLRLSQCRQISDENFIKLSHECPLLRHLDVSRTRISEKTVLDLCKNLNFLHCINIEKSKNPLVLNLETVHLYCSTLRFIQMGRCSSQRYREKGDLYAYSYLEKMWNKSEKTEFRCVRCQPSKEKLMNLSS